MDLSRAFFAEALDLRMKHFLGQVFDRELGRGIVQVEDSVSPFGQPGLQPAERARRPTDAVEKDDALSFTSAPRRGSGIRSENSPAGEREKDRKGAFPHIHLFSRTRRALSNVELTIEDLMV